MEPVEYQENTNTPPTSNVNFKNIGFLLTGGIIIFIIIFFLLNFFNILPLSSLFPNQLGWLPRQKPDAKISYNTKIPAIKHEDIVVPTASAKFSYDAEKAQTTLEKYIRDNLKENFLPAKIDVIQSLISSGETTGTPNEFVANWELKNISFNAALHYMKDSNELRDMEIYFYLNEYEDSSVNASSSTSLVKTYFQNIPESTDFDCRISAPAKFCEYFAIGDIGKNVFGVANADDKFGKSTTIVYSCFFSKNDLYYNKRTSCLLSSEKDSTGL